MRTGRCEAPCARPRQQARGRRRRPRSPRAYGPAGMRRTIVTRLGVDPNDRSSADGCGRPGASSSRSATRCDCRGEERGADCGRDERDPSSSSPARRRLRSAQRLVLSRGSPAAAPGAPDRARGRARRRASGERPRRRPAPRTAGPSGRARASAVRAAAPAAVRAGRGRQLAHELRVLSAARDRHRSGSRARRAAPPRAASRRRRERLVREIGERASAPERERAHGVSAPPRRADRPSSRRPRSTSAPKALEVELLRVRSRAAYPGARVTRTPCGSRDFAES